MFILANTEPRKDIDSLSNRLRHLRAPFIKGVVEFGSRARGEPTERSDVDLLVLYEDQENKDSVTRRRNFYKLLREAVGEQYEDITLIDMRLEDFLNPHEVTPLLLNIYWDGIVVYDPTRALCPFMDLIKDRIKRSGLKRIVDGRAYRWELPEPMKEVKIL
jgi:predicted nucleotidyltransferase